MKKVENEYACWGCGKMITIPYEPNERVFCESCRLKHNKEHKELVKEYGELKIKVMFENALRIMEKSNSYMYEYERSAKEIYELALQNDCMFKSSYEIITAIVLNEYCYEFEINKKILKYEVDFYIPELKVCLEIDGHLHNYKPIYDNNRDIEIRQELGGDWEVIRIPTLYLDKNPSMIPRAIEQIKKEKIKLRKENMGILPEYYSKRERAVQLKYGEFWTKYVKK